MTVLAWLIARPKIFGLLLLTLFAVGWHFQDQISDWWDDKKITRLEDKVAALEADNAAQAKQIADAEAAIAASKAARERNDREVGRIRSDTQDRVDRADDADAATRVSDAQAALDAYGAASDSVRAADPR